MTSQTSKSVLWGMALAIAVYVTALCINPSPAHDLFWQLRTGREIVTTHHLPFTDRYSWTRMGHPWTVHEWLAFVLFWTAYQIGGGFGGVWVLQVLLSVATFVLLFFLIRRETGGAPLTALLLTLGIATMVGPLFQPRPQLFTYLFLTITVGVILDARRNPAHLKRLWALPALFALWANFHAGVLVGVGLLAIFAVGDALESDKKRHVILTEVLITFVSACAILLNPYGYHLYQNFYQTLSSSTALSLVGEWASPDFHDPFGQSVECFLAATVFSLVFSHERKSIAEVLIVLALAHSALTTGRNVPLFALVGGILIARHLQSSIIRLLTRFDPERTVSEASLFGKQTPAPILLLVSVSVIIFSSVYALSAIKFAPERSRNLVSRLGLITVSLHSFPEDACRFIEAERFPTSLKMYNAYSEGGYLIWRLPEYPVSIDGRADVYFGKVLDDYSKLNSIPYDPEKIFQKYPADFVVSETFDQQARYFMSSPRWALVYATRPEFDHARGKEPLTMNSLIFLRRNARNQDLITRCRHDCAALHSPDILSKYHFYAAVH